MKLNNENYYDNYIKIDYSSDEDTPQVKQKTDIDREIYQECLENYPIVNYRIFKNTNELVRTFVFKGDESVDYTNLCTNNPLIELYPPPPNLITFSKYEELMQKAKSYAHFLLMARYNADAPADEFINAMNNIRQNPLEISGSHWEKHCVKKSEFQDCIARYNTDQKIYGSLMATSVEHALRSEDLSFDYILAFFCFTRSLMTQMQSQEKFGTLVTEACSHFLNNERNTKNSSTYLRSAYKDLNHYYSSEEFINKAESAQGIIKLDNRQGHLIVGEVDHKKVPLSRITPEVVHHTRPECVPDILKHVEKLFHEALEEPDTEKVIDNCAKIFWWLCQSKFVFRGDPSIAEMIVSFILEKHGVEFPGWKEDIIPWQEVMKCFTDKEFETKFREILDFPQVQEPIDHRNKA